MAAQRAWQTQGRSGGFGLGRRGDGEFEDEEVEEQQQLLTEAVYAEVERLPYSGGQGGAGGKSRRHSTKRRTPYERPVVGRHASAGPQAAALLQNGRRGGGGEGVAGGATKAAGAWLGGFGISKLISNSATFLYSSIFRRRLPALSASASDLEVQQVEANDHVLPRSAEADDVELGTSLTVHNNHYENPCPPNSGLSEIEQLLLQKTLSREECDRLTGLLQSRVVSNGEKKVSGTTHTGKSSRLIHDDGQPTGSGLNAEAQRWREDLQKSREARENGPRRVSFLENVAPSPPPVIRNSESLDGLGSTPVEVAIAFMGGRTARPAGVLSPIEPLHQRDDNILSQTPTFKSSPSALVKWNAPSTTFGEDKIYTPALAPSFGPPVGPFGRIQGTPRTPYNSSPYSRPLRLPPSRERVVDKLPSAVLGSPAPSRWTPIRAPVAGGRELLKRRSSALDDGGWTSVGPIRRTRHKPILAISQASSSPSRGLVLPATSPVTGPPVVATPTLEYKYNGSVMSRRNDADHGQDRDMFATTAAYVPAQSSETARKILETLDKMTPSQKGKSLEEELAIVRDRPPVALTTSMLNEQARKSMMVVEYPVAADSREAGPSGRESEIDPMSPGFSGDAMKTVDQVSNNNVPGRASLPLRENGSSVQVSPEQKSTGTGPGNEPFARSKGVEAVLASDIDKGKGFRMNASFEESGSDDEGRLATSVAPRVAVPSSNLSPFRFGTPSTTLAVSSVDAPNSNRLPFLFGTPSTCLPSFTSAAPSSTTLSSGTSTGSASYFSKNTGAESSLNCSSNFSFPVRLSPEGPPTPKVTSPASSPPLKSNPTLVQLTTAGKGEPASSNSLIASTVSSTMNTTVEPLAASKAGLPFSAVPRATFSAAQLSSTLQLTSESKVVKPFVPSTSSLGGTAAAISPNAGSGTLPASTSNSTLFAALSSAANPSFGGSLPSTTGLAFGGLPSLASTSTFTDSSSSAGKPALTTSVSPREGVVSFGSSPFLVSSGSTFGFASSPQSGPGAATAMNFFTSGSGIATTSFLAGTFGQFSPTPSRSPPALPVVPGPVSQAGVTKSTTTEPEANRQWKRPSPGSEPDVKKHLQPVAPIATSFFASTIPAPSLVQADTYTLSGSSSASTSSQNIFSSFRQSSSSATEMTSSTLPSGGPNFGFGAPANSAASTMSSPSGSISSHSSSLTTSVFGTAGSGSVFGLTPAAAPMAFGSSSSAGFLLGAPNTGFAGFNSESVLQPPSTLFGSVFGTPPQTSSVFSFGSSPNFSFSSGATSSSAGTSFPFKSSAPFMFGANKSMPASQPSPFASGNVGPQFESNTNGAMASDTVVLDQSIMEDSMSEEPSQIIASVPPQQAIFGGQSAPFVFGSHQPQPGATPPVLFGSVGQTIPSFPSSATNPFPGVPQASAPLDFSGALFAVGSGGGGEKSTRKFIKAKRTGARRGK